MQGSHHGIRECVQMPILSIEVSIDLAPGTKWDFSITIVFGHLQNQSYGPDFFIKDDQLAEYHAATFIFWQQGNYFLKSPSPVLILIY